MRTAGEILAQKRKELGLSLEAAEKETKIRRHYLEAIEKNNFAQIPEGAIAKGFIRNYAQYLGLSPESVLAVFRRDFCENEKGQVIPRGVVTPLDEKTFYWTPKATLFSVVFVVLTLFTTFFVKQYIGFNAAPPLQIFSPTEGQVLTEKITVSGKTDKDATVKIDGTLITIKEDGNFSEEIVLPRGENLIIIEASSRQGKKRTAKIRINVE